MSRWEEDEHIERALFARRARALPPPALPSLDRVLALADDPGSTTRGLASREIPAQGALAAATSCEGTRGAAWRVGAAVVALSVAGVAAAAALLLRIGAAEVDVGRPAARPEGIDAGAPSVAQVGRTAPRAAGEAPPRAGFHFAHEVAECTVDEGLAADATLCASLDLAGSDAVGRPEADHTLECAPASRRAVVPASFVCAPDRTRTLSPR